MRGKATPQKASQGHAQGHANSNLKGRETAHLKATKQEGRGTKTPTGKGLGKAGAKRLGRLLKRAIQDPEEPTPKGKFSLPKTPVRLFKHQIQAEAESAPNTKTAKPASPRVSQLILSVVSQCKHRGGLSMAELKQTLAAEGYDVTKNSRKVNGATKRLVNDETLVRTTRNVSFKLNNKKQTDTKRVRTKDVRSPKPKADLMQSKTASKSPKGAEKSQRLARKTLKPKGKSRRAAAKSYKPKGKTRRAAAKSYKPKGKTRKVAAKSDKPTGKTRRAAAKSHKPRKKTPKARRKSPKTTGRKHRSVKSGAAQARKAPRKALRARRRLPKQNQYSYKSSWKRQPSRRRLPRTRSRFKTWQRRDTRRRYYYWD